MIQSPSKSQPPAQDPQEIPKLARAYAQNRSLGVVVFLILFVLLFAAIAGSSHLAGEAYRAGDMLLFWFSIGLLAPALGATVYLSIPRFSTRLQERVLQRLYANEGRVTFSPASGRSKVWAIALAVSFGTCILASVVLGFTYDIPSKYMQPISALYMVPFLLGLWFLMRPMVGYAALLWPALYAIHAILILAGAPIVFESPWDWLNMLIPVALYGMLAGLVGHLYSRVALRKLKRLAQSQSDLSGADSSGEVSGQ